MNHPTKNEVNHTYGLGGDSEHTDTHTDRHTHRGVKGINNIDIYIYIYLYINIYIYI